MRLNEHCYYSIFSTVSKLKSYDKEITFIWLFEQYLIKSFLHHFLALILFSSFKIACLVSSSALSLFFRGYLPAADIQTVFDIAWYSFARTVSDVAPSADTDPNFMFSQGTILTCMACGRYFVRHSSRQRYCDNPNCQAERNNRKARAYYKRKKAAEKQ